MNLEFGRITGKNFQSFKSLDFSFYNIKGLSTLIMGENRDDEFASSNGAGKSAVLEAISWVLFGTTFRPLRYTDEVINLQEDECEITFDFKLDGKGYAIQRTKVRNKPATLKIYEESTQLLKDSDTKSKQAQLESIIGFNFSTFTNSVMFHLGYISFPELRPAERAEVLTDIGDLEIYVEAAARAKLESAQISSEISTINVEISTIQRIVSQLMQEDFDKKIEEWNETNIKKIRELRFNIIELKKEDKEEKDRLADEIDAVQATIADLYEEIDIKQEQYETLSENLEIEIEKNENREKQLIRESSTMASEIVSLKKEIEKYNKEISELKGLEGGKCPTCQQNVTAEHTDACIYLILKKLTDIQSQIAEKNVLYERLRASLIDTSNELSKYKQRKIKTFSVKDRLSTLDKDQTKQKGLLSALTTRLEYFSDIQTKMIREKESQLKERQESINPYIEMKTIQEQKISERQKELINLKNEIEKLADEQQYINFYIEGFKKIRLMLFDDLVGRLNELTQEYLSQYTSELTVRVSCEKQTKTGTKDELHIEIDRPEGTISYSAYSGGERQKIKLSISLALAQLIEEMCDRNCDTIFFDEPNDGLDHIGKKSNFDVFSDLASQGKTVVVIDHDAYFQDSFDNVITVVKENGYSRLEA